MEGTPTRNVPDPHRWWALALLCGAFFMVILDGTIVLVALPSIGADLGFSKQGLQWVLSAYALTFGGLLLLGGRVADLLGRRRVFMAGVLCRADDPVDVQLELTPVGVGQLAERVLVAGARPGEGLLGHLRILAPTRPSARITTHDVGAARNSPLSFRRGRRLNKRSR